MATNGKMQVEMEVGIAMVMALDSFKYQYQYQEGGYHGWEFNRISNFQGIYRNLHMPAVIIGGAFVLIALLLSTHLILQHLRSYNNPAEQKWIIGVLLMVPVYASESMEDKTRTAITQNNSKTSNTRILRGSAPPAYVHGRN